MLKFEPGSWPPIETAPKDGSRIIVLGPICDWNRDNQWVPGERIYACISAWTDKYSDHYHWQFLSPGLVTEIIPTFWAPLPESVAQAFEAFDGEVGG